MGARLYSNPISLGDADRATVTIDWPSGEQTIREIGAGDRVEIVE